MAPSCPVCGESLVAGQCPSCGGSPGPASPDRLSSPGRTASLEIGQPTGSPASRLRRGETDALLGQVVSDRYLVRALIGRGGVGRVYRALQLDLERAVALKVLDRAAAFDPERRERFRREARNTSMVGHPGVAAVYDLGEWDGYPYIAMELVPGRTFFQVFAAEFPLPPARLVEILAQVCEVLDLAHRNDVIHRDLKPENIMVMDLPPDSAGATGEAGLKVKLLDFGLALLVGAHTENRLTRQGVVSGTPYYMSPEQCRGESIDARSDVYALGVMLYEQLCGRLPFLGESGTEVLVKQLFSDAEPPSLVNPGVTIPPALEGLCLQAMEKEPGLRPQSAMDFCRTLREAEARGFVGEPPAGRSRSGPVLMPDRMARVDALGIPETPRKTPSSLDFSNLSVLVVEQPPAFAQSLTALLRRQAFNTAGPNTLDEALKRLAHFRPDMVVVDLSTTPGETLTALSEVLQGGSLSGVPVLVVGPGDSIDSMARSLALGIGDYLAREEVHLRLPGSLRWMMRRR